MHDASNLQKKLKMKRLAIFLLMLLPVMSHAQTKTLKDHLTALHERFGVNFVYESSLDMGMKYDVVYGDGLEECLQALFDGTDIEWDIRKRYVVLNKEGKNSGYTILIRSQIDTLKEAMVTAQAYEAERRSSTGLERINARDINRGYAFMSSPDIIKSLQNLPGVASGTELLSGLHVHGGDGSDNLFLLDGTPIYQAGHLGGLFSSFNSDIVKNVDFYKSGFPARFGGRLSSVVDAKTETGDMYEYHGSMSIGLIDGRLQFEGPMVQGKTSFNIALRRSWLDAVTLPVFSMINIRDDGTKHGFNYAFQDLNAGITHRFSADNILEFKTYYGRDALRLHFYMQMPDETMNSVTIQSSDMDLKWGNFLTTLIWKYRFSPALTMNTSAWYSRGYSMMDVKSAGDGSLDDPVLGTYEETYKSITGTTALKSDLTYRRNSRITLDFGGIYQIHVFSPERRLQNTSFRKDGSINTTGLDEKGRFLGHEAAIYAEGNIRFTDRISSNLGFRYVIFGTQGKIRHRLEPRISMRYDISSKARLDISYTEMNQFAHQMSTSYLDLPTEFWMPSTQTVKPLFSRQAAAEFSWRLPSGLDLGLGGWYKTMDNLMEQWTSYSYVPPISNWGESSIIGKGRSYGLEAEADYNTKKLQLTAYYTISWNERRFEELWYEWYPDRNDNRHKITLMANYRFTGRFDIYAGWNWHSGNKTTIFGYQSHHFGRPNNLTLPDYHRLDLGMNFRKTTRKGNESIWNVSIYNAYCRMNPMFAEMQYNDYETTKGLTYGIVPIIPSFSYTLKF